MKSIPFGNSRRTAHSRLSCLPLTLLFALPGLSGCGSNAANPPAADPHAFSGSWGVYPKLSSGALPTDAFVGDLEVSNGVVSGTLNALTALGNPCVEDLKTLNVKGTVDALNNLVLTVPISTGIATITAHLAANPQAFVTGSYQIDGGGGCAMPATPMIISQYAPVSGTYSGTLNVYETSRVTIPSQAVTISAVLTQSAYGGTYGLYQVLGTVTSSGACAESVTLKNGGAIGGVVISQVLLADLDPAADNMVYATFQDNDSRDPNCNQLHEGTLARH